MLEVAKENILLPFSKVVRQTPLFTIYEILLNDTRFLSLKSRYGNLKIRDDDDIALKRLYVFEEELKMRAVLLNKKPRLTFEEDRAIVGEKTREKGRPAKVRWSFLFRVYALHVIMKKRAIEIPGEDYVKLMIDIMGGKHGY